MRKIAQTLRHTLRAGACFVAQMKLLLVEVPIVWFYMWRLKARALPDQHGWLTGMRAAEAIWPQNLVYRSAHRSAETAGVNDEEIVCKTGDFLRRMVSKSASELAHGPKRRMPHAVNYIHGAVHYNGLTLIFDDFLDLARHLHDPLFRTELLRVAKLERRELTFLFRKRDYDVLEFAYCVGVARNFLPWFSNANGPSKKPVLWGNVAPYPAINLINGAWIDDLEKLRRGKTDELVRAPVDAARYFQGRYALEPNCYGWLDRFQAWWISMDVRARGFRGQLFFTDRKLIEPHRIAEYRAAGGYLKWSACHTVPFPRWRRVYRANFDQAAATRARVSTEAELSVIIPTLNEATVIGACIDRVRAALPNAEIIVSDGGSTDATLEIARLCGARCVQRAPPAPAGRGAQLLEGIAVSTKPWLLLLHADSLLDQACQPLLAHAHTIPGLQVAKLSIRFDSPKFRYRCLEQICKLECVLSSFGDQGTLVDRQFLEDHKLLQPLPLFEDVDFFARARRRTRVHRLPTQVSTSVRRFERLGFWKTNALNMGLMALYLCRVSPTRLHRFYNHGL